MHLFSKTTLIAALLTPPLLALPQEAEEEPTQSLIGPAVAYRVDRIETLDGKSILNGVIVVRDGVIEKMGDVVRIPDDAEMRDLRGQGSTILPPLVLSHAPHLQRDSRGTGRNGRFRAIDSIYLDEDDLPDLREEGILLVGVDPPGGGIPGRSSVLGTHGEHPRPTALVNDLYLKLTLDASRGSKDLLRRALKDAETAIEKEQKAKQDWQKKRKEWEEKQKKKAEEEKKKEAEKKEGGKESSAAAPQQGDSKQGKQGEEEKEPPKEFEPPKIDPNLIPIVEWIRKQRVAQVEINTAAEWLHWLDVLGERELPFEVVLYPSFRPNFNEIVEELSDLDARVYLPAQIAFLPNTRIRINLAAELSRAGGRIVLLPPSRSYSGGVVRWRAALAEVVREGLPRETALKAVTLEPAASLGQEEQVQALTIGGPATFIVLDGDVLDPTAEVEYMLKEGKVLYDRKKEERKQEKSR